MVVDWFVCCCCCGCTVVACLLVCLYATDVLAGKRTGSRENAGPGTTSLGLLGGHLGQERASLTGTPFKQKCGHRHLDSQMYR